MLIFRKLIAHDKSKIYSRIPYFFIFSYSVE